MIDFLLHIFVVFIYQPFYNVLLTFYWFVGVMTGGHPNMGVAVILLSITMRILILPLSIAGWKKEGERLTMAQEIEDLHLQHGADPVLVRDKRKEYFRSRPQFIIAEMANLGIQILIALIVWRIFSTGLEGKDDHLVYGARFLQQQLAEPYQLEFMGRALTENRSVSFVLVSVLLIFILETISVLTAPKGSMSRERAIKAQLALPIISFILFLSMPAGKVLFLIATFVFSIVLAFFRMMTVRFGAYKEKKIEEELKPAGEKVLVETRE